MKILNIAAGKIKPISVPILSRVDCILNVDTSYYSDTKPEAIEDWVDKWDGISNVEYFCNEDIFTFMERTKLKFDRICLYRFLEHIPMDKVLYFIYLVSTVAKQKSIIDVIVPNYETLAEMILTEDFPGDKDFEAHNILLTTELLNQPPDPHTTIWTPDRMKYFWELEGRFELKDINNNFDFDGRDIYIRAIMERL